MKIKSEAERLFLDDVREKKNVSRSYRNKRTHCGRGGAVRLPSDKLTKKELQKMNGQCETYKLNQPMKWPEFLAMPVELQITYVKKLREKYGVPDTRIARMMFINQSTFSQYVRKLGIPGTRKPGGYTWDKDGWYLFAQGVAPHDETEPAEITLSLDKSFEFTVDERNTDVPTVADVIASVEHESFDAAVEKDQEIPMTPADEFGNTTESWPEPAMEACKVIEPLIPIIPASGAMSFEGRFEDVLKSLSVMLGSGNGKIHIAWDVA